MPVEQTPIDSYGDIHDNVRFWLRFLSDEVRRRTGDPAVIYDIGSNDGEISVPLLAAGHTVVAFEPQPEARRRLMERVGGTEALTLFPCALGDRSGEVEIHTYSDDSFSSAHARPAEQLRRYGLVPGRPIAAAVERLDDLSGTPALSALLPGVVKIDVEGSEAAVLRGARATLARTLPAVVIEYSCLNVENAGGRREEIRDLLGEIGYASVFGLFRNRDRHLHSGAILADCRIWNLVAVGPGWNEALGPHVAEEVT